MGEHVPADVEQHDGVAAELARRLGEPGGERAAARRVMSSSSTGLPRCVAICDSENSTPSRLVVPPSVSTAAEPQGRPPRISSSERGPGRGSIGERSQATPPRTHSVLELSEQVGERERADDVAAAAHADQQGAVRIAQRYGFAIRSRLSGRPA